MIINNNELKTTTDKMSILKNEHNTFYKNTPVKKGTHQSVDMDIVEDILMIMVLIHSGIVVENVKNLVKILTAMLE